MENVDAAEELVLSREDAAGTYRTMRHFEHKKWHFEFLPDLQNDINNNAMLYTLKCTTMHSLVNAPVYGCNVCVFGCASFHLYLGYTMNCCTILYQSTCHDSRITDD